jgi:hypothetical protein
MEIIFALIMHLIDRRAPEYEEFLKKKTSIYEMYATRGKMNMASQQMIAFVHTYVPL